MRHIETFQKYQKQINDQSIRTQLNLNNGVLMERTACSLKYNQSCEYIFPQIIVELYSPFIVDGDIQLESDYTYANDDIVDVIV